MTDIQPGGVYKYTRADLTVGEVEETEFGRKVIVSYLRRERWSEPERAGFILQTTEKMDRKSAASTLVHECDPETGEWERHKWHGAFQTIDINECIDSLVEYINEIHLAEAVRDDFYANDLTEAIEAFQNTFSTGPNFGRWNEAWAEVIAEVDKITILMAKYGMGAGQ